MFLVYTRCMKNLYTYRFVLGIIILVLCAGLVFMSVKSYMKWGGNHYFGTVVEVKDSEFIVTGRKNTLQLFNITEHTTIKRGYHTTQERLHVGDRVIVFAESFDWHLDARLVRIMGHTDKITQSQ